MNALFEVHPRAKPSRPHAALARLAVMLFLLVAASGSSAGTVVGVESFGITVRDMPRAIDFYTRVLPFEVVDEKEVSGTEFERLYGVFGMRAQIVRLRLGEEALRFYRDGLGMKVLGDSENYGIEQERLNNVFGARLKITAVGASEGPAIEFLEYLTPRTGRPIPETTQANDLWYWLIRMRAETLDKLPEKVTAGGGSLVSPGVIEIPQGTSFANGLHVRGPTGHALMIHSVSADQAQ